LQISATFAGEFCTLLRHVEALRKPQKLTFRINQMRKVLAGYAHENGWKARGLRENSAEMLW